MHEKIEASFEEAGAGTGTVKDQSQRGGRLSRSCKDQSQICRSRSRAGAEFGSGNVTFSNYKP
jgi:hypothetical protein